MNKSEKIYKEYLKRTGGRDTKQKRNIIENLSKLRSHFDIEDFISSIRKQDSKGSRATVYRTIDVLVKNNLVRKMELGDGRALYEHIIDDKFGEHHDHIICVETGDIDEFYNKEIEKIQKEIVKKRGYKLVRAVHQLFVKPINK